MISGLFVGSGPGGSTLAYRLGEQAGAKILLLEAGGEALGGEMKDAVESGHRWNELLLTDLDWAYNSAQQPTLGNVNTPSIWIDGWLLRPCSRRTT